MLKSLRDGVTGEPYLLAPNGQQFRRTVVSLCWPFEPYSGCVVVLGELRELPTTMGEDRHVFRLDEFRSFNTDELIDQADKLMARYKSPRLITAEDDRRYVHIELENDKRKFERKQKIRTEHPGKWHGRGEGMLIYYLSLIERRGTTHKTLFFGQNSTLPLEARLAADNAELNERMIKYPGMCALSWALEYLDTNKVREYGRNATYLGAADSIGGY